MRDPVQVETFADEHGPLCHIVRTAGLPDATLFPAPATLSLQAGFIVHPKDHEIARHEHVPVERTLAGTGEVLLVLRGRCEIDVYDHARQLVATRVLETGDLMIMSGGGHGFRMLEDTVLFEVKQGPYFGPGEKERF
jgi:hypothetical protein